MKQYKSKYTDSMVTAAQKIAEIMCERQAAANKQVLERHFWKRPAWKKKFAAQIQLANSLLKLYEEVCIFKALDDRRGSRVYSLTAPWLDDIINEYQLKQNQLHAKTDTIEAEQKKSGTRPKKKGGMDRLRGLDE